MKPFNSAIDTNSPSYLATYESNKKLCEELAEKLEECRFEGTPEALERVRKKGRLTARERIELVLDQDSPFLELLPFAGYGQDDMSTCGGMVIGIGLVRGIECIVSSHIATLKGGSMDICSLEKAFRCGQIINENRLPVVGLVESGGANLTQAFNVFHIGGGAFRNLSINSRLGIPTISVVLGNSSAGGAYAPGLSDYVVAVKNQTRIFVGGPALVKMATGEEVDEESLGGAEMHSKVSGVSDYLAQNEIHAIQIAREIVGTLNFHKKQPLPPRNISGKFVEEPIYSMDELLGIVTDVKIPFDSREVIARIVDGSRFAEFKKNYGPTMVTVWAYIQGIPVGILANNGVLFSDASNKGAHFIQICNKRNIPIIFMHNITGFMVGRHYEEEGMIKNGSKLINAISNSGVPHISLIMSASYGAGNYGMCGRAYRPRFLFTWPTAKCAIMGGQQLAGVMDILQRQSAQRTGRAYDEERAEMIKKIAIDRLESESTAYYCSSRCLDDGIIDPRHTRTVLGICLSVCYNQEVKGTEGYGISRM